MNSSKHGRQQAPRPYLIEYAKGDRLLRDSARTLDEAKTRCANRLAKRHNRGETATVFFRREVVHSATNI